MSRAFFGEGNSASWSQATMGLIYMYVHALYSSHAGGVSVNQMVEGLKMLGFDVVFDTNFAADLTVR